MSFKQTPEQERIITWTGNKLVVGAFAGTGKTSTLEAFARANPERRMLYLAYNRAIRDEAERRFPFNVECKTSHQLAWSKFGRFFQHRLTTSLRITDVAKLLNSRYWPLAKACLTSLNNFLYSADSAPCFAHLPDENDRSGLDAGKILGAVQVLWREMSCSDSRFAPLARVRPSRSKSSTAATSARPAAPLTPAPRRPARREINRRLNVKKSATRRPFRCC